MNNTLNMRKEFLLRKQKGHILFGDYIKDLENLLSMKISKDELISLEETDSFKNIHIQKEFKKSYDLSNRYELDNFILFLINIFDNELSYLFTYYSQFCGAVKIKTKTFLENYRNIETLKNSIASVVSEDLNNEILFDFDNEKLDFEIKGEKWISIAESYKFNT